MRAHWAYFKYVLRHKWFVFLAGLKYDIPLHQLIIHDWDKFLPFEWHAYVRTFYRANGSSKYVETPDFAVAWNNHQKRNKHHWQHWLLTWDRGETVALPIPTVHLLEMIADWRGARRAIIGKDNVREWYAANCGKIILHPATRKRVETLIGYSVLTE